MLAGKREVAPSLFKNTTFVVEDSHIDPLQVLELNERVRWPGTPWIDEDGPWPSYYFVIGDDECGNYWALDLRQPDSSAVYFYDHDLGNFEKQHDSLQAFARQL
jgi:hypothetical protein